MEIVSWRVENGEWMESRLESVQWRVGNGVWMVWGVESQECGASLSCGLRVVMCDVLIYANLAGVRGLLSGFQRQHEAVQLQAMDHHLHLPTFRHPSVKTLTEVTSQRLAPSLTESDTVLNYVFSPFTDLLYGFSQLYLQWAPHRYW